jgi:hypothetical protein
MEIVPLAAQGVTAMLVSVTYTVAPGVRVVGVPFGTDRLTLHRTGVPVATVLVTVTDWLDVNGSVHAIVTEWAAAVFMTTLLPLTLIELPVPSLQPGRLESKVEKFALPPPPSW